VTQYAPEETPGKNTEIEKARTTNFENIIKPPELFA
jgi:hypothetical protein